MAKRIGKRVIELENSPCIYSMGSCVGKKEGEGPLSLEFDVIYENDSINQGSWEQAESKLINKAVSLAVEKNCCDYDAIDLILAGDLLNQCTASSYGVRDFNVPFCGLFGACSTMAYSLALAALMIDGGGVTNAVAAASSHFCSAEKQFRYPLEYGAQRPPSAQRTVTGAGAFLVGKNKKNLIKINRILFGKIVDLGIADTANMGAAMAPAAADSIYNFLTDTNTSATDYDLILTGDLGKVGSGLLIDLLKEKNNIDISEVHNDCGLLIYDLEKQDVDSGGSGCGCSAVVTASYIMRLMNERKLKRVLFAGTGALMSPLISLQGETVPGIAHIVEFTV